MARRITTTGLLFDRMTLIGRAWPVRGCAGLVVMAGLALGAAAGCAGTSDQAAAGDGTGTADVAVEPRAAEVAESGPSGTEGMATAAAMTPTRGVIGRIAVVDGEEVPAPAIPMGDEATLARIIDEGVNRNRVMEHLTHLTQTIGPRLTGSTRALKAGEWLVDTYKEWGLNNPHQDEWGTISARFDRGPSRGAVMLRRERRDEDGNVTTEYEKVRDLQFSTPAWSVGTSGPVRGPIVWMPETEEEYAETKEKLAGAWVLLKAQSPIGQRGVRSRGGARAEMRHEARKKASEGADVSAMTVEEKVLFDGIAGFISTSRDKRVWTGAAPKWRTLDVNDIPVDIEVTITTEDYDYINSRVADGEPIEVEFELEHTFTPGPIACYNVVAEIPGTERPEEVVIVSAHLDSWDGPGSEGCTDNGTGTVVTLEAARILMASGAKPRRTIRFIHWTGEEQGLLGSRAYVEKLGDQLDTVSVCFVDDGGTNYQGGLPAIESMVPYLAAATAPVNNLFRDSVDGKPLNVNVRTVRRMPRGGGSDHASFNQKGVPGFFWDEVGRADYGYGWHTQFDRLDLAIPEYLMQSATCTAITAYNLACAAEMLPRQLPEEPPPAPAPAEGGATPPPTPPNN